MKKIILSVLFILLAVFCLFAEDNYTFHEKGDSFFSGRAGVSFPVLEYFPKHTGNDSDPTLVIGTYQKDNAATTNLTIGGYASLGYSYFLKSDLAVGGEIGYNFNFTNENVLNDMLAIIPITAKVSYIPYQSEKFEFILNANAGACVLKYNGSTQICPYIGLSVNPVYSINENWGIGLDAGVSGIAELRSDDDTCIALFAPVTLSVKYSH